MSIEEQLRDASEAIRELWANPAGTRERLASLRQRINQADHAQAARDGATGPEPPAPPLCPNCGLAGERRRTYTGHHVLLDPRLKVPAHLVPVGHRWYIDANGLAWNGGPDEPSPGAFCRIPHRLTCPGASVDGLEVGTWLATARKYNAALAQRETDGYPHSLSETR
ncbi:DUF6083 domain-containing protein [Streptomyces sp. NPDC049915]|uniref:DUF6083 domain-containing protein n=1 Tax=Streptomyces sp. NPDC049915 TaxID=3155510 RepID=UPI0034492BD8